MLQSLGGAVAFQLALLVSGTLSARLLGPTNRGYLAVLAILPSTVAQLGAVGISLAVTYYLAAGRIGGHELADLLRRSVGIQVLILTAVSAALLFGYILLSEAPILLVGCISILLLPAVLALDYGIALALGARRHDLANIFRLIGPILSAVGLAIIYAAGGGTLQVITWITVTSAALAGLTAIVIGLKVAMTVSARASILQTTEPRTARREILAFGRRGYIGYLSPMDSLRIDQLVVLLLLAPSELGIYVVGAAFTTLPRLIAVNIGLSATAEVARHEDLADRRQFIRRTLAIGVCVLLGITAAIGAALVVAIPVLFGEAYASSLLIGELLLLASCLLSIKRLAVDLGRGAGETRMGTGAEVVTVAIFLVLCIPGGLTLGGTGIAGSLVVAAACGSIYLARRMSQLGYLPWSPA